MRVRAFFFSLIILVFLCGPLAMNAALQLNIELPEAIKPESAKYLSGGWSEVAIEETLNTNDFASGKMQAALEKSLNNLIPAKESVLLNNAKFQRMEISTSATIFGFEKWPTYFGSSVCYSKAHDSLSGKPSKASEESEDKIKEFGNGLAEIAQRYSDKSFCIIVADDSTTSIANPAHVSDDISTKDTINIMQSACREVDNVTFIDSWYSNASQYYEYYYTTDHHWNGWGALDAYKRAIHSLSNIRPNQIEFDNVIKPFEKVDDLKGYSWINEHGSYARSGLMMVNEDANEPTLPTGSIRVEQGPMPPVISADSLEKVVNAGLIAEYDFYQTWYGPWIDTVTTCSNAILRGQEALIICDSFGTAFKWVAASGFSRVTTKYDLHNGKTEVTGLSETLNSSSADTIFLVARTQSFMSVLNRFSYYLDYS